MLHKDIVWFSRKFSSLIESGFDILTALKIITGHPGDKRLKIILEDIIANIEDGKPFSDALALHPEVFSGFYVAMVRSGEAGGVLEKTMKYLADFLEKEEESRNAIRGALIYPFFVLGIGVLTVITLLWFVIPRPALMFKDLNQELPFSTRALIGISRGLGLYWWVILPFILLSLFLYKRVKETYEGKLFLDTLKLKIKFFGNIIVKAELARFMRILALLLGNGSTIIDALSACSSVVTNQVLEAQIQKIKIRIAEGDSFSESLKGLDLFPQLAVSMIGVGEETGSIERSFQRIADDYDREVDSLLKNLSRLLEPIIILAIGLVVGFIVFSMLLPIFQLDLAAR